MALLFYDIETTIPPTDIIEFGGAHLSDGGKVPYREARRDYEVVRRMQRESLQLIRPGMDQFQANRAIAEYLKSDREVADHYLLHFVHGIGLELHEEPVIFYDRVSPQSAGASILYQPGALVSSEWFSRYWTVEDPFVMDANGSWQPLHCLRPLSKRQ